VTNRSGKPIRPPAFIFERLQALSVE
jgi:hypothetical protein